MAKDKHGDDKALDKNAKKPKADDRILGLGKLIGRKPPKPKKGK
jgi:hypothetical protein